MEQKLKIAVFIDFDNIEIGVKSTLHREFDVEAVLDALKERGEIVTKFAYANWGRQESATRALQMSKDERLTLARIDAGEKYPDIMGSTQIIMDAIAKRA